MRVHVALAAALAAGVACRPAEHRRLQSWAIDITDVHADVQPSISVLSLWPAPHHVQSGNLSIAVNVAVFSFSASQTNDILISGFDRYYAIIFGKSQYTGAASGGLTKLEVFMSGVDDTLFLGVDESYELSIAPNATVANLTCANVYGCLRGLETFAQCVVPFNGQFVAVGLPLVISDHPRFPHRGLMIDTARHFLPLPTIFSVIDGMVADKANTLHWHLTDVQSFPFASAAIPALAAGAYSPSAVYTPADLSSVVRYARYRGIRVVPELDTPAHALSWSEGRPDLVLPCPNAPYDSVLDPTREATYTALASLIGELAGIFPDGVFHAGGDEVIIDSNTSCYNTPSVVAWMAGQGIAAGDWKAVTRYHLSRVQAILSSPAAPRNMAVWEEVLDHYGPGTTNPTPAPAFLNVTNTIVHLWFCPCWSWFNMSYVTELGFRGVKNDDYYLDGDTTWDQVYTRDPLNNAGSCDYSAGWANCTCGVPTGCYNITDPAQASLVLGGEASAWAEHIDEANLMQTVWPRMSSVAERLWSRQEWNDPLAATPRLVDHVCRLRSRGVAASPIQPSWCDGSRR